ncbi:MAG: response regulator transcription factor [Tissierellia bacterium]|nr:response regulator transcription factor [Tissierellia bacterium]
MDSYKILIVEDEVTIANSIKIYLTNQGFVTKIAKDGKEAISLNESWIPDLIIMDLMMPGISGEEAIMEIRKTSYTPIIILSAKSEDLDKIMGLNIGADDYMTKPFNPMELIARVNSNLRRFYSYGEKSNGEIRIGSITLNTLEKLVTLEGKKVNVTSLEYQILELLMTHPNQVFSIDEIYEKIWKEPAIDAKTVTVHIRRIREKIEVDPKHPQYLQVAWGLGYKFVSPERRT